MTTLAQPAFQQPLTQPIPQQPVVQQPVQQPVKQAKAPKAVKNSKPTKSLEKLLTNYFGKPYSKDGKTRRAAPRIIVKALADIDAKSMKNGYQDKIKALKEKYDSLPTTDAQGRNSIQEQIDKVKKEEARLYGNLTRIPSFEFMKEFESCNGDVSKILDPELRGYITILGNKIDKDVFKKLIDKFNFTKVESKDYAKILTKILNTDKYKMKIFNASFTHPDMRNKQGQVIMKKIKKQGAADEPMKLYLKRFCRNFETVLAHIAMNDMKPEDIVLGAMKSYIQDKANLEKNNKVKYYTNVNLQDVWNKAITPVVKGQEPKYDKATRELIGVFHSVKSMIEELSKYPNLAAEYQGYITRLQTFEQIKTIPLRTADDISLLQSLCDIVKACSSIGIEGFQDLIFNDFIQESGIKFKPEIKKKLRECAISGDRIQLVEQQFETVELKTKVKGTDEHKTKQVAKNMKLAANQFLREDISVLESVETMYDTDKYDRIGKISEYKASKAWHVALALRLLKEIKYVIAEGQARGQNQFVFAL